MGEPKTSIEIYFRYVNNARKIPKHVYDSWCFHFPAFENLFIQCNRGNTQRPLMFDFFIRIISLVVYNLLSVTV